MPIDERLVKRKTVKAEKKARVLKSQTVFKGRVFEVKREDLVEPSGIKTTREIIAHPGSVVVLPAFRTKESS